jgi:hypothetical protein
MTQRPMANLEGLVYRLERDVEEEGLRAATLRASKVVGWSSRKCKLAHAFRWQCGYKGLKLARLLGQRGVFLT